MATEPRPKLWRDAEKLDRLLELVEQIHDRPMLTLPPININASPGYQRFMFPQSPGYSPQALPQFFGGYYQIGSFMNDPVMIDTRSSGGGIVSVNFRLPSGLIGNTFDFVPWPL